MSEMCSAPLSTVETEPLPYYISSRSSHQSTNVFAQVFARCFCPPVTARLGAHLPKATFFSLFPSSFHASLLLFLPVFVTCFVPLFSSLCLRLLVLGKTVSPGDSGEADIFFSLFNFLLHNFL